jgi:hypothetical protein
MRTLPHQVSQIHDDEEEARAEALHNHAPPVSLAREASHVAANAATSAATHSATALKQMGRSVAHMAVDAMTLDSKATEVGANPPIAPSRQPIESTRAVAGPSYHDLRGRRLGQLGESGEDSKADMDRFASGSMGSRRASADALPSQEGDDMVPGGSMPQMRRRQLSSAAPTSSLGRAALADARFVQVHAA